MLQAAFDNPGLMIVATGMAVGTAAALIGPFLILRRNSMLSDAISHSIVFGIVVVWLLTGRVSGPVQIMGAALTGVLTVFLTEALARSGRVKDDAAIGLVFPALFAAGVLLLNLYARDVHIDVHAVLLGEIGFVWIDTMEVAGYQVPRSLVWMAAVAAVNAGFVTCFWKELKLATFDPVLAQAFGMMPRALFYGWASRKIPAAFTDRVEFGGRDTGIGGPAMSQMGFLTSRTGMPGWTPRTTRWPRLTRLSGGRTSGRLWRRCGAPHRRRGNPRRGASPGTRW